MEDPVAEIPSLVLSLCTSTPTQQRETLETYFLPSASFTHPFCRTGSFQGSRWLIWQIYRWYKIMSPRIDMVIDSVAWDQESRIRGMTHGASQKGMASDRGDIMSYGVGGEDGGIVYVGIRQQFKIWFVPFYGKADARLVTVLHLEKRLVPPAGDRDPRSNGVDEHDKPSKGRPLYYIKSQQDLYQVNEFIKFTDFTGLLGGLILVVQLLASFGCALLALLFWPVSWVEERVIGGNKERELADVVKG